MLFDEDEDPSADLGDYADVLAFWRSKAGLTGAALKEMTLAQRAESFTVAGLTQLEEVNVVWEEIDRAIADGTTLADFKKNARAALERFSDQQVETIFRTNIQTAYSAGRQKQQTDPAVLAAFPYWQFVAVLDGRTSAICSECADIILPANDSWWRTHQPPLHHNCRSTVKSLDAEEAAALGVDRGGPSVEARKGFGDPLAAFVPDLSDFPPELVAAGQLNNSDASD